MSFVGGTIDSITIANDVVGTRTFAVKSDEAGTLDTGGFRRADDENMIASNGVMVDKITRVRWKFGIVVFVQFDADAEMEFLSNVAGEPTQCDITITTINAAVWGGRGSVVGTIEADTMDSTLSLTLQGGPGLARQV